MTLEASQVSEMAVMVQTTLIRSQSSRVGLTVDAQSPAIHLTGDEALALHRQCADWRSAAQALRYLADRALARGDDDRAARFIETAHAL